MKTQNKVFKRICRFCLTFFIFIISAPLIMLAIPAPSVAATTQVTPTPRLPANDNPPVILPADSATATSIDPGDKPEYDMFTFRERQEKNLPTAVVETELYYGKKVIYLTFDDGPDQHNTPLVLDILKKNHVKATFFVVGTEVEKNPDVLRRVYDEGHAIGNHSYNHVYRDLYQSATTYVEQLHQNDELIKNALSVRPHISRAPGGTVGHFTKAYWDTLKGQGYLEVGWNISSGDASSATAQQLVNNIIAQTEKNTFLWSHAILLMHDGRGHSETVKALPDIIKYYKEHGFEFRVINSKTPPAW